MKVLLKSSGKIKKNNPLSSINHYTDGNMNLSSACINERKNHISPEQHA